MLGLPAGPASQVHAHTRRHPNLRTSIRPRSSSGLGYLADPSSWGLLLKRLQNAQPGPGRWPAGYGFLPQQFPAARGKEFVIIRHGHSTWNAQSKIQGNSDQSELTEEGVLQSVKCRDALHQLQFDSCFSSPITRARQAAEIICDKRIPVSYLDSLQEAHLGWFQGLRNDDAARDYPDMYSTWREQPENFCIDGQYPIADVFQQAGAAWDEMMRAHGSRHLVVTHKSILRALLCTALGLPPCQFRAFDAANGSISAVRVTKSGQLMVVKLNVQGHLVAGDCSFVLPQASVVERGMPPRSPSVAATANTAAADPCSSVISALPY